LLRKTGFPSRGGCEEDIEEVEWKTRGSHFQNHLVIKFSDFENADETAMTTAAMIIEELSVHNKHKQ
jgi:hypothetical protein